MNMYEKISPSLLPCARIKLDIGEYFVIPLLISLVKEVDRKFVDNLIKSLNELSKSLEDTYILLLNDRIVYSQEHVIYSINVGLRCAHRGPQFARKPELNIICVLTVSSQIDDALEKLFYYPIRNILAIVISRDLNTAINLLRQIVNQLQEIIVDICICYKCTRDIPDIRMLCEYANDIADLFQCVSEIVLDRIR